MSDTYEEDMVKCRYGGSEETAKNLHKYLQGESSNLTCGGHSVVTQTVFFNYFDHINTHHAQIYPNLIFIENAMYFKIFYLISNYGQCLGMKLN